MATLSNPISSLTLSVVKSTGCEITSVYAALRHLHKLHRLPKATRIACIPVRTAHKPPIKLDHFPALLHTQDTFHRVRRAIQSSANTGKTTSKTFANPCHRNILTASR